MPISEEPRANPPFVGGERDLLDAWLDFHRATLLRKCAGLDEEQLKRLSCPPSSLSLLGIVRHMTDVENGWFSDFAGRYAPRYHTPERPDADFTDVPGADAEADIAVYREEVVRSRELVAGRDLDETFIDERGRTFSLRWVYLHMIEEYARHNGHADLIRERIDGVTGV